MDKESYSLSMAIATLLTQHAQQRGTRAHMLGGSIEASVDASPTHIDRAQVGRSGLKMGDVKKNTRKLVDGVRDTFNKVSRRGSKQAIKAVTAAPAREVVVPAPEPAPVKPAPTLPVPPPQKKGWF